MNIFKLRNHVNENQCKPTVQKRSDEKKSRPEKQVELLFRRINRSCNQIALLVEFRLSVISPTLATRRRVKQQAAHRRRSEASLL